MAEQAPSDSMGVACDPIALAKCNDLLLAEDFSDLFAFSKNPYVAKFVDAFKADEQSRVLFIADTLYRLQRCLTL